MNWLQTSAHVASTRLKSARINAFTAAAASRVGAGDQQVLVAGL